MPLTPGQATDVSLTLTCSLGRAEAPLSVAALLLPAAPGSSLTRASDRALRQRRWEALMRIPHGRNTLQHGAGAALLAWLVVAGVAPTVAQEVAPAHAATVKRIMDSLAYKTAVGTLQA